MNDENRDKAHELLLQIVVSKSVVIPSGNLGESEAQAAQHTVDFLVALYQGLKTMYGGASK